MSSVITVRVPKKLRDSLGRHRVEVSKVVRKALEDEVRRIELKELERVAGDLGELFSKVPDEEIVESIRHARRSR